MKSGEHAFSSPWLSLLRDKREGSARMVIMLARDSVFRKEFLWISMNDRTWIKCKRNKSKTKGNW